MESQLANVPIISSNCPTGPSEILDKGKYGDLFPVKNYRNLSKKILMYAKNKRKYKKKILEAYKSLNRFDNNKNCKSYLIEVKKLMKIN